MSERTRKRYSKEYFVEVDWFRPQQLQGVIDSLTNFGLEILNQLGSREGRVEVKFFKPGGRLTSWGYDASTSLLILNSSKPPRMPLRLRKPDSSVKALRRFGVDFGVKKEIIIVRSSSMSRELALNEEIECAANLMTCLLHYPTVVTVERKKVDGWEPIFPQGKIALNEPLLSR
jgi:hypothetical protein